MGFQHRGELALAGQEVVVHALHARAFAFVAAQRGGVVVAPAGRVEQGHVHLAAFQAQQRLGAGIEPFHRLRSQQGGFDQVPQRRQALVVVLHGHHRGQVVDGEVARVLDPRPESVLGKQGGVGLGHAQGQQLFLQRLAGRSHRFGRAHQHERQHPQATAGQRRFGLEWRRHLALGVGTEGQHARALATAGCARMQFQQALVQRPARAQCLGRIEVRARQHQVQVGDPVHQPGQVAAHAGGQFAARLRPQRIARRWLATGQFQGHHAAHHARLSHGRHSAAGPGEGHRGERRWCSCGCGPGSLAG